MARGGTWPWVVVLAVAAFAGGMAGRADVLVHIAYLLVGLVPVCAAYARSSLRALDVRHQVSTPRLVAGERLLEVWRVSSRAGWPAAHITVSTRAGIGPERPCWSLALPGHGHEELTSVSLAVRRGRYVLGGAEVAVCDPFGLSRVCRTLIPAREVIVWPRPRIVPSFSLAAARAGDLLPARRSWASMPVSGAVRPFAYGDSSNRIHWLSSARHGLLMVKESDRSVGQRVWIALDLSSAAHVGSGDDSTAEYGVEAAAYVAELAHKAGLDVGLVVAGAQTLSADPRRGRDQREHLLDLLAAAQAGQGAALVDVLEDRRIVRPSDAVVCVTPDVPDALLDYAARLRRLGCGVAVVVLATADFGGRNNAATDALDAERIPVYVLHRDPA